MTAPTVPTSPADTTEIETPPWFIRPEQPIDLDQIHEVHRAAFGRTDEADLVDAIRSGPGFVPQLSLVAVTADGTVLGHVLVSRVWFEVEDTEAPRTDVLALAPLAVMPEPFAVVLGSPTYYSRFGFVPATDFGVKGPYDAAGEAFQVRPRRDAEVAAGTVHYPAMFAAV